jgi:hypothetical protein
MSTILSADQEAVLAKAVSLGLFDSPAQALDEAIRMLSQTVVIDAAITAGLESGEPINATDGFWTERRAELLRRYEAGNQ